MYSFVQWNTEPISSSTQLNTLQWVKIFGNNLGVNIVYHK